MADIKIDIFNVSQMEIVIKGGIPSNQGYRYVSNSGPIKRSSQLTETEKNRIKNYTVLNTSEFEKRCNDLNDTASEDFNNIIAQLIELKDKCGEDVFSLNGETMEEYFDHLVKEIEKYIQQINEYTDALISRGKTISAKQEEICNNTIKFMNTIYKNNEPEVQLYQNPQNLKVIK